MRIEPEGGREKEAKQNISKKTESEIKNNCSFLRFDHLPILKLLMKMDWHKKLNAIKSADNE